MEEDKKKNMTADEKWELEHPNARGIDEIMADARDRADPYVRKPEFPDQIVNDSRSEKSLEANFEGR